MLSILKLEAFRFIYQIKEIKSNASIFIVSSEIFYMLVENKNKKSFRLGFSGPGQILFKALACTEVLNALKRKYKSGNSIHTKVQNYTRKNTRYVDWFPNVCVV